MKALRLTIFLSGFVLSTVAANASGIMYLDDNQGNLWAGDPITANYNLVGNSGIAFTDIGFAGGVLYGLGPGPNQTLYSIDTATGVATSIGPTGIEGGSLVGLSDSTSGVLIAGGNGNIYSVNTSTGAATPAVTGGAYTTAGDDDFDGSGNLWLTGTAIGNNTNDELYQIFGDGTASDVGTLPYANVFGMAYDADDAIMFGFETGGTQFDVNLTDATGSNDVALEGISDTPNLLGAAWTDSPEPSTFGSILIGSALVSFAVGRRRNARHTV